MNMRSFHLQSVNFAIAGFLIVLALTRVSAQAAIEVTVGVTTVKPDIDGLWQQDEWQNAIEYKVLLGLTGPAKVPAYFRMMHDDSALYGVFDVPSDIGTAGAEGSGGITDALLLAFYYGEFLNPNVNQTQLYWEFGLSINQTTNRADVAVNCRCPGEDPNTIVAHSKVAASLSTTKQSNSRHRVWEFSIPMNPYVIKSSLATDPSIGFAVIVFDSTGNELLFVNANQQRATLAFVSTVVPENQNSQVALPLVLALPLIFMYDRKHHK